MTCQVYKALDCEHDPEQLRMQSATVANLGEKYTQGESTRSSSKDKWGVRILERVGILSGWRFMIFFGLKPIPEVWKMVGMEDGPFLLGFEILFRGELLSFGV